VAIKHRKGVGSVVYDRKWSLELAMEELVDSELRGNVLKLSTEVSNLRSTVSRTRGIQIRIREQDELSKILTSGQFVFMHFKQFGKIISHKMATGEKGYSSSFHWYILYESKEAAAKARFNPNPGQGGEGTVTHHNVNGVSVEVRRDNYMVPNDYLFFITFQEIDHDTIKNYFSSFGQVKYVRNITRVKQHVGYQVIFTSPDGVSAAMEDNKHAINDVEFSVHRQDTRHCIDKQLKLSQSITIGPIYDDHLHIDELKAALIEKCGEIHSILRIIGSNGYFRVIFKNPTKIKNIIRDGFYIGEYKVFLHYDYGVAHPFPGKIQ